MQKYMNPLKNPENSHIIDNVLVDDIFFQIPNILKLHEGFLDDLKRRLEDWDCKRTIGDWFLNNVSEHKSDFHNHIDLFTFSSPRKQ